MVVGVLTMKGRYSSTALHACMPRMAIAGHAESKHCKNVSFIFKSADDAVRGRGRGRRCSYKSIWLLPLAIPRPQLQGCNLFIFK